MIDCTTVENQLSAFSDSQQFGIEEFEIDVKDSSKFLLGKGSFATVYKTRFRGNGRTYAMKVVS